MESRSNVHDSTVSTNIGKRVLAKYSEDEAEEVHPDKVLIVVGSMILLKPSIRNKLHIKVYLETDEDVRLSRRVLSNLKELVAKKSIVTFLEYYFKFVKPAHEDYVEPSKKYANLIIPNYGFSEKDKTIGRLSHL